MDPREKFIREALYGETFQPNPKNQMNEKSLTEIQELVRKSLPEQLSNELRAELNRLVMLEAENKKHKDDLGYLKARVESLEKALAGTQMDLAAHGELKKREDAVLTREQAMKLLELRAQLSEEARKEMRSIVSEVFANNRFKYTESYTHPVGVPPNGYVSSANGGRSGETQG